eukprot:6458556-Amphidinium_carterae.2
MHELALLNCLAVVRAREERSPIGIPVWLMTARASSWLCVLLSKVIGVLKAVILMISDLEERARVVLTPHIQLCWMKAHQTQPVVDEGRIAIKEYKVKWQGITRKLMS